MRFKEYLSESVISAYHGTNRDINKFKITDGIGKESMLWFTDDYDYASQQGKNVLSVSINQKNELTVQSLSKLSDDDIIDAMVKLNKKITKEFYLKTLKKRITRNIESFKSGTIPIENIFAGMGGVRTLKSLGFDFYKMKNPYDKTKKSYFYMVLDDSIIKIRK